MPCPAANRSTVQGRTSLPTNKKLEFQGVLFCTYSLLVSGLGAKKAVEEAEANAAGPSSHRGKDATDNPDMRIM